MKFEDVLGNKEFDLVLVEVINHKIQEAYDNNVLCLLDQPLISRKILSVENSYRGEPLFLGSRGFDFWFTQMTKDLTEEEMSKLEKILALGGQGEVSILNIMKALLVLFGNMMGRFGGMEEEDPTIYHLETQLEFAAFSYVLDKCVGG